MVSARKKRKKEKVWEQVWHEVRDEIIAKRLANGTNKVRAVRGLHVYLLAYVNQ